MTLYTYFDLLILFYLCDLNSLLRYSLVLQGFYFARLVSELMYEKNCFSLAKHILQGWIIFYVINGSINALELLKFQIFSQTACPH